MNALTVQGRIEIVATDVHTGKVDIYQQNNLITNNGLTNFVDTFTGNGGASPNYFQFGTSTIAPGVSDTKLVEPNNASWKGITVKSRYSLVISSFEATYTTTELIGTWRELGLWCGGAGAGSGTLIARAVIADFRKSNAQTVTVSWRVQFGRA